MRPRGDTMLVSDLVRAMESIAPLHLAEPWDNVGLLVGSADRRVAGPILLTIDLTECVLAEAVRARASAIVAYHPPLWEPIKRITSATPRGRVLLGAIEAGIAIYSPHTALDATAGGVTDWLCEGLSGGAASGGGDEGKIAGDCRALMPHVARDQTQEVKIVTFVPESAADELRSALATAGAGIIGGYQVCSFATPGTGTFFGSDGTTPTVGQAGRLERTPELRLEMVCSKAALPLALETLRRFHPYEEPAVDVYELLGRPERSKGPGRRLVLDQPATLSTLAERLKAFLSIPVVNVARAGGAGESDLPVTTIGVVPGSGASMAAAARADGCEVFVTGEMKHHELLDALNAGTSVILAGHTNTERGYLPRLARRLSATLPDARVVVSQLDRSPRVPV
ncbi:MAG: Nif3-like dinuclear metal center hexameric protein [Phycisphaerales bacterium]